LHIHGNKREHEHRRSCFVLLKKDQLFATDPNMHLIVRSKQLKGIGRYSLVIGDAWDNWNNFANYTNYKIDPRKINYKWSFIYFISSSLTHANTCINRPGFWWLDLNVNYSDKQCEPWNSEKCLRVHKYLSIKSA
jgi:hypothetical protein